MDRITTFLAFLTTLSLATERITEMIKGLPVLSGWLAKARPDGTPLEEARKASIHILAIGIGTLLTSLTQVQLGAATGIQLAGFWPCLLFGAMASGGSGIWNSALDIVREVNRQKQHLTEDMLSKK